MKDRMIDLLDQWRSTAFQNGDRNFVGDGLLYKSINSENMWENSPHRVAFIGKEPYFRNYKNYDKKYLSGENYSDYDILGLSINHRFWRNILTWTYGLFHARADSYSEFEKACSYPNREYVVRNIPVSFVNIKKEVGSSSASNTTLRKYVKRYQDFLKCQLQEILRPNILFCCGTSGLVMNEVYDNYNFKKIDDEGYMYFCEHDNIMLIASYHPTARISNIHMYNGVMNAYSGFLKQYSWGYNKP